MTESRLSETRKTAEERAAALTESAREAASRTAESTERVLTSARGRTDQVAAAAGQKLQTAAGALRERVPQSGIVGSAANAVADRLEGAGRYLQEENLTAITDDLAGTIRRYPIHALLIGTTVGFLLGRLRR